ncbi:hypothetical protein [Streptomyces sp. NPDC048172]|uniref:hypothetical protein n=1 Tax=Streptomyces sp. NPDC048172 TaxID=3365505 RepID=UPI00371CD429
MTADRPRRDYEVLYGSSLVGHLSDVEVDQPWFVCRFEPGEGWAEVSALYAAQEEARRQGFPPELVGAIAAVRELGVELRPVRGGELIRPFMLYLSEDGASFRY